MFGNHGLGGLLEEGAHEKSPKCLGGNLGDFGGILQRSQNAKDNHFSCHTATASAFTPSAEIAFVQLDGTLKNLIGNQDQIMADNHTNFAVEQNGGVGLNAQNIGSGTGSNLEYKKIEQFFLNSLA